MIAKPDLAFMGDINKSNKKKLNSLLTQQKASWRKQTKKDYLTSHMQRKLVFN